MIRKYLENAVAKRAALLTKETDSVRLVDGSGDGVPGFALETYAGNWLAITSGNAIPREIESWLRESGKTVYWKRLDQHQKDSPVHLCGAELPDSFPIFENGIRYEVSFASGYSQGIFLDQRLNRAEVRKRARKNDKILNLFSYTGGFSVAAALGGAETTTLDLSSVYLDWAKRNFRLNGLNENEHHFCKGDAFHWLKRFAKQGREFHGIIVDPPTFSRDEKGKVFRVERDFGELARLAGKVLAPGGWVLCCTNFRKVSESDFGRMVTLPGKSRSARAMPSDFAEEPYLKSIWLD